MRQANLSSATETAPRFDMRALIRLATWGMSATSALLLAVLSAYPYFTSQQSVALPALETGAAQRGRSSRSIEVEGETSRLAEAVRDLSADREALLGRLRSLEQSLEDITGSNRQTAAQSLPVETPAQASSPPNPTASYSLALPQLTASRQSRVAAPATIEARAEAAPAEPTTEFGIDLGSAVNFDALRVLWNATKAGHAPLLDALVPHAVQRVSTTGVAELRLVAGPLTGPEVAARLCDSLTIAARACQPAPFEGQQLALAASEPDSRSPPIPERRPAHAPAQPARIRPEAREPRLPSVGTSSIVRP
jgi:hypothetical protein